MRELKLKKWQGKGFVKLYGESSPVSTEKSLIKVRLLGKIHSAQVDMFDSNLIITDGFRKLCTLIDHACER